MMKRSGDRSTLCANYPKERLSKFLFSLLLLFTQTHFNPFPFQLTSRNILDTARETEYCMIHASKSQFSMTSQRSC